MAYQHFQALLAALYTNQEKRQLFFASPEKIGKQFGCSEDESRILTHMFRQDIENFASSLIGKRLGQVKKHLPCALNLLGCNFHKLFFQYADTYVPKGLHKHQQDAIQFAQFLREQARSFSQELPEWFEELADFEAKRIEFFTFRRRILFAIFQYPVHQIFHFISQHEELKQQNKQKTIILWTHLFGTWKVWLPKQTNRSLEKSQNKAPKKLAKDSHSSNLCQSQQVQHRNKHHER